MPNKIHKGGTPKGVAKPHNARTREKSGVKRGKLESYADVGRACSAFLRRKIEGGEMAGFLDGDFRKMGRAECAEKEEVR